MDRAGVRPARGLRWAIVGLAVFWASLILVSDAADARYRRHRSSSYQPPYAAIVIDANSGQVLHATNPDSLRHPASLTKIMTLYLLFEQLDAGKLKLDSRLPVSEHAASQSPTKLGLTPGQSIAVEDAIKAIVTKSANDAAVVVAEAIGGGEDEFATLMTRKARALGMTRTVYANASGLPDDEQVTTARDQAILGRAIQDRFPRHYRFFSTPSFRYHGVAMRNHNRLLGRVAGIDGIKTGYTRSSGFNLVSSVRRGNRHIVAVVLGGSSAGTRDSRMRDLIESHIAEASTRRTAPMTADATEAPTARPRVAATEPPTRTAEPPRADVTPTAVIPVPRPGQPFPPGSAEPIRPVVVKTIPVKAAPVQSAALAPLVVAAPHSTVVPPSSTATAPASQPPVPPAAPHVAQPAPSTTAPLPPPPGARPGVLGVLPARVAATEPDNTPPTVAPVTPAPPVPPSRHPSARGEWTIQIGAFPDENQARERLKSAQNLARSVLGNADPFTERVMKGSRELFRARFAGFDKDGAEAACHYFKRNEIACLPIKN